MELIVIRHLPTKWNELGILQGKRDVSITDVSSVNVKQINKNIQVLVKYSPYDCVLTSRLKRTIQTASIYGFQHTAMEPLADELDFGDYEGQPRQNLIADHEKNWFEDPITLTLGEELAHFQDRLFSFLEKYKDFSTVLLFGHGSWIRGMASIKACGTIANMNKRTVTNNMLSRFSFSENEIANLLTKRGYVNIGGLKVE